MSKWREKALRLFPDLREDIEDPKNTVYNLFFELLPRLKRGHQSGNQTELENIYSFAKWCFQQKSHDLSNAAAVAFYEHLVDEEVTLKELPRWITPGMFDRLYPLFQQRMSQEAFHKLFNLYRFQKRSRNRLTGR